jgi:hypothetical protein
MTRLPDTKSFLNNILCYYKTSPYRHYYMIDRTDDILIKIFTNYLDYMDNVDPAAIICSLPILTVKLLKWLVSNGYKLITDGWSDRLTYYENKEVIKYLDETFGTNEWVQPNYHSDNTHLL